MSDPLSPSTLINKSQSLCSPSTSLPSPSSVLLLVLHSLHSSLSFRLISPTPQDESNKLTQEWPAQGDSTKFKYKHDQSSLEFIISVVDLGDKLMVLGNAVNVNHFLPCLSLALSLPPSLQISTPPLPLTQSPLFRIPVQLPSSSSQPITSPPLPPTPSSCLPSPPLPTPSQPNFDSKISFTCTVSTSFKN